MSQGYNLTLLTDQLNGVSVSPSSYGSTTDNAVARFDGTTGTVIQNSGVIIDDSNNVSGVNTELVGSTANFTDFPVAKAVVSEGNSGANSSYPIGLAAEAISSVALSGVGLFGAGITNGAGNGNGVGVYGQGLVNGIGDSGKSIGGYFDSTVSHNGADNVGVYSSAVNAAGGHKNYSFYGALGDIYNNGNLQINGTASGITTLTMTSMGGNWTNASRTIADLGIVTTAEINGGTIDGTTIGGSTPAAGTFTTIKAAGAEAVKIWTYTKQLSAGDVAAGNTSFTVTAVTLANIRSVTGLMRRNDGAAMATMGAENVWATRWVTFDWANSTTFRALFGGYWATNDWATITIIEAA